jgi:8-oxo-dGTP pyrophosphatase MutT (NUDIX family)
VDSAGLVLIRDRGAGPEVLMGRRHRRHGFLPGIYVFPGGRVDPADRRSSGYPERFHPDLLRRFPGTPESAAVFVRAALRETFEEAGLLLGQPQPAPDRPVPAGPVWQAFRERDLAPSFTEIRFVCRAITPASSPRRFHTRFLLADGALCTGDIGGDGELEDLAWWPLDKIPALRLVDVTEFVLKEALELWRARGPSHPALMSYRGDRAVVRRTPA